MNTQKQSTEIAVRPDGGMLSAGEIKARVQLVHDVMRTVMKKDVHYGVIPGTQKPSLWKAGAEKLAMTFNISVELTTLDERISDDEVSYRVRALGKNAGGDFVGSAEGTCSTSEKKYRWREPVHPKEFAAYPDHMKRITYSRAGAEIKQVRQDPGDLVNTILQMASKRASVQMIRGVTGATDIFAADPNDDRSESEPPRAGSVPPAAGPDLRVVGVRTVKTGEKDGRPWTLFAIKFSNGNDATTFNEDWAKLAEQAQSTNALVTAKVSEGKKPGQYDLDAFELVPA